MKIPHLYHQRKNGFILGLAVIVVAVVVIGWMVYHISKVLKKLPTSKPLPPDELYQSQLDFQQELALQYPNASITTEANYLATATTNSDVFVRIDRNTNLNCNECWEYMTTLTNSSTWVDTNQPWPQAFYRRIIYSN